MPSKPTISNSDGLPLHQIGDFIESFGALTDEWNARGYSKSQLIQLIEDFYPDEEAEEQTNA